MRQDRCAHLEGFGKYPVDHSGQTGVSDNVYEKFKNRKKMKDKIIVWLMPLIKALRIESRVLEDLRDVQDAADVVEGRVYRYLGGLVKATKAVDGREPDVPVHRGVNVGEAAGGGERVTAGCCLECDLYLKMPCPRCKDGLVYKNI